MSEIELETTKQGSGANEIITSGHVWTAVWYLAWPTAINTIIQTAYGIINAIFVGRLPNATDALAAVGIGNSILMIQFGLVIGLSAGTSALIARFVGAGDYGDADAATGQSLLLSVIAGIVTGLPLVIFAVPIVSVVGASGSIVSLAADYTAISSWFSIPMFLFVIITSAIRSTGDMRSPLYAGGATIVINILFDWLLIFGIGPFSAMGVRGAAISTAITRVVGMLLMFWFLQRSELRGWFRHLRWHSGWSSRIMNIGWPAAAQNLLWSTAFAGFIRILALLPAAQAAAAQAALTVSIRIESFAFMPGVAYSIAATPLVGQNLGAGKPDRAEYSAWVATGQAVAIMTAVAVLFLAIPHRLALMFTNELAVVPLIVSYLRINALSEPLLAVNMVLRGALQGAGDTRFPMWTTVGTLWALRLPLAWALSVPAGLEATGAWIAMSATTALSGIIMAIYFRIGRWRRIRV